MNAQRFSVYIDAPNGQVEVWRRVDSDNNQVCMLYKSDSASISKSETTHVPVEDGKCDLERITICLGVMGLFAQAEELVAAISRAVVLVKALADNEWITNTSVTTKLENGRTEYGPHQNANESLALMSRLLSKHRGEPGTIGFRLL